MTGRRGSRRSRSVSVLGVKVVSGGPVIRFEGVNELAELAVRGLGGGTRQGDLIAGIRQAEACGMFRTLGFHSHAKLAEALRSVEEVLDGRGGLDPGSEAEKVATLVALKTARQPARVVLASFSDESIQYALGVLIAISGGPPPLP